MKKFILLTTALLSSISAYAVCTPPTTLKCNCAHPIIENGVLACGASYCGDKKCMPDGSCCESEKYCEVGDNKYCCADGQTCDTTKGCVETVNECNGKNDYTPCQDGNGYCLAKHCFNYSNTMEQQTEKYRIIRNTCAYSIDPAYAITSQGGCCLGWPSGTGGANYECKEYVSINCADPYEGESICNGKRAFFCTLDAYVWTRSNNEESEKSALPIEGIDQCLFCID